MGEHTLPNRAVGVSGFSGGCRCDGCVEAKRIWRKQYALRQIRQEPSFTDAAPARRHLLWLQDNGVSYENVAERLGVSSLHVGRIATGKVKRVRPATADAILAIGRDAASDTAFINAALSWRRIHGLMALGYPMAFINVALGYHPRRWAPIGRTRTTVKHARAVIELCKRYGSKPGPSARSRKYALRLWEAYGEWDDDLTELTDYVSSICVHCGGPFPKVERGRPAEYCSDRCRAAATRAREAKCA